MTKRLLAAGRRSWATARSLGTQAGEWGVRPTLRYAVRRAGWRAWHLLQHLDFVSDLWWRRDYLVRHGARIATTAMVPEGLKVVGPADYLEVGKFTGLAQQTIYITSDGRLLPYFGRWHRAPIRLGDDVHMGGCAVVLPGLSLGPRAAVAASSVVERDVPAHAVVSGRPARLVANFERFYQQTVEDMARRPNLYVEPFPYARADAATDSAEHGEWQLPRGDEPLTRARRFLRNIFTALWVQLQEPDEFLASQQRILLMRKQGYRIGRHSFIHPSVFFDSRADKVTVGDHCAIGPNVAIHVHDGFLGHYIGRVRVEPVRILDGCSIGAASVIMPGITIGPGSVVEPGSTVLVDVPPYTVVGGSPARKMASLWDWIAARQREIEAHPEHYVLEDRFVPYPVPSREAINPGDTVPPPAAAPLPKGQGES